MNDLSPALLARREALIAMVAGGVLATSAAPLLAQNPAEKDYTPEESLRELMAGNSRFVNGTFTANHRDMERLKQVAPRQRPFAAFLGCADSRVPIEIVFDQGFGDLFVTRIAGNLATSENIASLEFGTLVLGAKVLFVLGHTGCGAVNAAMNRTAVPGQISQLYHLIRPAIRLSNGDLDKAVEENVKIQAEALADSSPVISELIEKKQLILAGGVYDLQSGQVKSVKLHPISAY